MKVLFSIPNFDTAGSGKALLKVALGLNANKFEPHIMCLHARGGFFKQVEESGIPFHIVQYTTPMKPYLKGIWNCYKISRLLRSIDPDIIHSFHYAADYSEPLAAKLAGIKWIYTKKNMNWGGKSKNGWNLRSFFANAIVVQNSDMIKEFFPNSKKVYQIPRGVDVDEFKLHGPQLKLREQWGISEDKRVLICVANLVPVKGIEVIVGAYSKLVKKNKEWMLFIVGDHNSDYGQQMMKLSKTLGINEHVVFTGKQQNVVAYLNLAEVFVLPTLNKGRREGSPVALLEAMACGKNVLASDVSGIRDQLIEFPSHLIKPGDIASWVYALERCMSNSIQENKQYGKVFRTHVVDNFTIEREVRDSERMYMDIV